MSNPTDPFDSPALKAIYKQITDAWNAGMEQAKRAMDCKMRRFDIYDVDVDDSKKKVGEGLVFSDGALIFRHSAGSLYFYEKAECWLDTQGISREIRWIDAEKP